MDTMTLILLMTMMGGRGGGMSNMLLMLMLLGGLGGNTQSPLGNTTALSTNPILPLVLAKTQQGRMMGIMGLLGVIPPAVATIGALIDAGRGFSRTRKAYRTIVINRRQRRFWRR